jgi:hypothetical protein
MTGFDNPKASLPNIFPDIGPVTRSVLFADFDHRAAPTTGDAWLAEYETLIEHSLAGVALRVIRQRSIIVPPQVLGRLQESQFQEMMVTSAVVRRSQSGIESLRLANIPFVVTKGPGIALQGISVTDRPYIDLDVLVDPSHYVKARSVLASVGYRQNDNSIQPWGIFDRYCQEATNLRTVDGGSIDLHHRVSPWYWSTGLSFDLLATAAKSKEVFGAQLPLASPEHNLLVTGLHVVSDKTRPGQTLRAWRDVLVLAGQCSVDSAVEAAKATGLCAWMVWIFKCLPEEVQPIELLLRLDEQEQRLVGNRRLRLILPPRLGSRHVLGLALRLPTTHAALYAAGVLVPSSKFLRFRFPDERYRYLLWWRSAFRNLISKARHRLESTVQAPSVDEN